MRDLYVSFISILLFTSCNFTEFQLLECQNMRNKFFIKVPIDLDHRFVYKGVFDDGNVNYFKSYEDSITIKVTSNFLDPKFDDIVRNKWYTNRGVSSGNHKKDTTIIIKNSLKDDSLVQKYVTWRRVDYHDNNYFKYNASYVLAKFTPTYTIRVDIIMKFKEFDLGKTSGWVKKYRNIEIIPPVK